MAMGAGLGFPVGDLILRFPPPTSDFWKIRQAILLHFAPHVVVLIDEAEA